MGMSQIRNEQKSENAMERVTKQVYQVEEESENEMDANESNTNNSQNYIDPTETRSMGERRCCAEKKKKK
jgi:hypothetical protein